MAGKADVVNAIAVQAGITKKEALAAFEALVGYVTESCRSSGRCSVAGLGNFTVTHRESRKGRNPRTKEIISIPASKRIRFKAGKDLRDCVNVVRQKRGGY
jgi:DNA-binding protein HU-beta